MSEMRKAARGLVATREEAFASAHSIEESVRRLKAALPGDEVAIAGVRALRQRTAFDARWIAGDPVQLAGTFLPTPRTPRFLQGLSLALTLLVAACAWAFIADDVALTLKAGLVTTTTFALLGFPFIALKLASDRGAEEQAIVRTIRKAFERED